MKGKRKGLRIVLYVLLTLVVLLVGTVHGALYTPLRNTLIAKATESSLNAQVRVGKVRLRFFLTFPDLSLELNDISMTYPVPSDTVLGVSSFGARLHVPSLLSKERCIDVRNAHLTGVKADFDWSDTLMIKPSEKVDTLEEKKPLSLPCMKVDFTLADTDLDILDYVEDASVDFHLVASNSAEGVLDADISGLCIKALGLDFDAEIGGRDLLGENPRLLIDADALAKVESFRTFFPEGIDAVGNVKLMADGVLAKKGADLLVSVSSPKLRAATSAGRFAVDDIKLVAGVKDGSRDGGFSKRRADRQIPSLEEEDFKSSDIDVRLDSSITNLIRSWNPRAQLHIGSADVRTPMLPLRTSLDGLDAKVDVNSVTIDKLKLRAGASDLDVKGSLSGLSGLLTGKETSTYEVDLDVHSHMIQANQLMAAIEKGSPSSEEESVSDLTDEDFESENVVADNDTTKHELKLFVIPANVKAEIHVHADDAIYSNIEAKDLNARVRMAERTAQVIDLKAKTDFGSVSADAFYSTKSKKNINAGADISLNNITADKVIELVPAVDTLVPILSSFKGNLNCELAVTTKLDTLYNPDLKTAEGAFRITGRDLTLDQEGTFKTVAKILMFKDRKQGRIDTLYMSGTVHNNMLRVYPFQLELDRYSLVLGGMQRFDNKFDYKVSLLRSPLMVRFGVRLWGTDFDHLKWKLMKAQYKGTSVPSFHEDVEEILYAQKNAIRGAIGNSSVNLVSGAVERMESSRKEDLELIDDAQEMSEEEVDVLNRLPKLKLILSRAFPLREKINLKYERH